MVLDVEYEFPVNGSRRMKFDWLVSRVLEQGGSPYPFPVPMVGVFERDLYLCLNRSPRRKQPFYLLEMSRRHSISLPAPFRALCRALVEIDQDGRRQDVPHEEVCQRQEQVYTAFLNQEGLCEIK